MNRKGAKYISYVKLSDSESEVESDDTDEEYHSNYSFICIEHGSKKAFRKKANGSVVLKPDDYIPEEEASTVSELCVK